MLQGKGGGSSAISHGSTLQKAFLLYQPITYWSFSVSFYENILLALSQLQRPYYTGGADENINLSSRCENNDAKPFPVRTDISLEADGAGRFSLPASTGSVCFALLTAANDRFASKSLCGLRNVQTILC